MNTKDNTTANSEYFINSNELRSIKHNIRHKLSDFYSPVSLDIGVTGQLRGINNQGYGSEFSKGMQTAQFQKSSQPNSEHQTASQYKFKDLDELDNALNIATQKIEMLELEMRNQILKNNELTQIIKFYQANLSRLCNIIYSTLLIPNLALQIDSDLSFHLQNASMNVPPSSLYSKRSPLASNENIFFDNSRQFSFHTENELNQAHINISKKYDNSTYTNNFQPKTDLFTSDLRSIEEEEAHLRESLLEKSNGQNESQQAFTVSQVRKLDYHENLMRSIENQIQKIFMVLNQKFALSPRFFMNNEEKRKDTFSKKRTQNLAQTRRSQTPLNIERMRINLKDSFNQGGGTGSASGVNQYFLQGHNLHNMTKGSHASIYNPQNMGMSPSSNQGYLPGAANETLNNGQIYANTEISKDNIQQELNNNNSHNKKGQFDDKKYSQHQLYHQAQLESRNSSRYQSQRKQFTMNRGNSSSQIIQLSYQPEHNLHEISSQHHKLSPHNISLSRSAAYSQTRHFAGNLDQTTQSNIAVDEEPSKWMPNEKYNNCQICTKSFGLIRRKHHCRGCGLLVCSSCSPEKAYVPGYKDRKVRICKNCELANRRRKTETKKLRVFTSAGTYHKK